MIKYKYLFIDLYSYLYSYLYMDLQLKILSFMISIIVFLVIFIFFNISKLDGQFNTIELLIFDYLKDND